MQPDTMQQTTCSGQHAADNMQQTPRSRHHAADTMQQTLCSRRQQHATHAPCNMRHATCNAQHATCDTQHATHSMQHARRTAGSCLRHAGHLPAARSWRGCCACSTAAARSPQTAPAPSRRTPCLPNVRPATAAAREHPNRPTRRTPLGALRPPARPRGGLLLRQAQFPLRLVRSHLSPV